MDVRNARALAADHVVDITTTGRQTGQPRRMETRPRIPNMAAMPFGFRNGQGNTTGLIKDQTLIIPDQVRN